jgi:hypothetical protein
MSVRPSAGIHIHAPKNRLGISAVALCRRPSYPLRLISLSAPYDGRAAAIGAGSQMGFRPLNDARECCTAHFSSRACFACRAMPLARGQQTFVPRGRRMGDGSRKVLALGRAGG